MAKNQELELSILIGGHVDNSLAQAVKLANTQIGSIANGASKFAENIAKGAVAAAGGIAAAVVDTTKESVSFESEMLDVTKYVSGLTDDSGKVIRSNYEEMSKDILDLSTDIPYTAEELTRLAAAAGQSGKSMDDLISDGFLRDVAEMGTAMDISADQAGDWAAKWEVAFDINHDQVMELADQINYLGAHYATTAAEIAQTVNDTGSLGQIAGMDVASTAALSTALLAMGVDSGKVATSIRRMYTNLSMGSKATDAQAAAFEQLGFTAEQFAKDMQTDAPAAIKSLFTAIGSQPKDKQVGYLKTLLGQWAIESGAKLTGNLDLFIKTLDDVGDASKYNGSMYKEFLLKCETSESVLTMLSNAWRAVRIEVGNNFLPILKDVAGFGIEKINDFRAALPDITARVKEVIEYLLNNGDKVAATLGGIGAAWAGMRFAPQILHLGIDEMEVVRDSKDNCIIVCSIENFDPMGVHTGDSITVAPAQTLSDLEYQRMRVASLAILEKIGVETGGSNVQFAVNPQTGRLIVIEMNPRVSRSSALASKATGFPIAKAAARLAVGYTLDEIVNDITKATPACFEPTIDYCVVKVPRFAFEKFKGTDPTLTTRMKAVGEIMAIGRTFEEAFGKAMRSLEDGHQGICAGGKEGADKLSDDELARAVATPTEHRIFFVVEALRRGWDVARIHAICGIDPWYLNRINDMVQVQESIRGLRVEDIDADAMRLLKQYGTSDAEIAALTGSDERFVRAYRKGLGVVPSMKTVDTCAAEFSSATEYHYKTYENIYRTSPDAKKCVAPDETTPADKPKAMILGAGPNRIGQGIEFDYCCVHASYALAARGFETIMVNCNPETVSTDYDTSDRLYFEPLTYEDVMDVIDVERPDGVVVTLGGQTPLKLARMLEESGVNIMGTKPDAIDFAEDRERFDELLERCNIPRAPGRTVFNLEEALAAADEIGLPVLMRPSYVLGGQNMIVAYTKADVIEYMGVITEHVDMDHPVLLDKYIMGTECEVDAICDGENYLIPGIMEQVERTGVHSGDSICVYPAQHLTQAEIDTMVDYTGRFARELHVTGLVNVQYAVSNGKVYVIEVNPRSSRTVPYISKVTGVPMVDLAVRCCLGEKLTDMGYGTGLHPNAPYVAVKVPVFSFEKLHGVDTQFGPEMKSTGEVLGIAPNFHDALLKGLIGAGYTFKTPGPASCCIFTVKDSDKPEFVDIAWKLKNMGYKLYGTSGTCAWLNKHMVPCNEVRNMSGEAPNIVDLLQSGLVDYVFSTSAKGRDPKRDSVRLRRKAVELSIPCITAVDTANALVNCLRSDHSMKDIPLVDIATLYHKK